jgi:DUF1365 family protein
MAKAPADSSALYRGFVTHTRRTPRHHHFRYNVFSLLIDLDELPGLDTRLTLFGWNRSRVFSFHDCDHGDGSDLRAWLDTKLADAGIEAGGQKRVLCYPRIFGYVFNPLSVWFCHKASGALAAIVYEVHNTYGERHAYVLPVAPTNDRVSQRVAKGFYVSPFLSQDCTYNFRISPPADDVLIAIDEEEHGAPVLNALFAGKRAPLSDRTLLGALLRYPLMTLKVVAAIHYEAVRLMAKGVARHPHSATAKV